MNIEEKLVVLKYLYPYAPRKIVDNKIVVGNEDGTENTPPVDIKKINFKKVYDDIVLRERKDLKKKEINKIRDFKINGGMEYTIKGNKDIVQTREKDKSILLGLNIKAAKALAITNEPVIRFRSGNDQEYLLTPQQTIDLTEAASEFIETTYQESWSLKDMVDIATSVVELDKIEWN